MTTRAEAITAMGEVLAEAEHALYFEGTVADAARRAYTPTGPSIDELERRIAALRIARFQTPAASTLPDARQVAAHPEPQPVPSPNPVRSAAGRAPQRKTA